MVRACIASCLNQGQLLRKIIVVDDGSEDLTSEVVSSFVDENYLSPKNIEWRDVAARRDAFKLSMQTDHKLR